MCSCFSSTTQINRRQAMTYYIPLFFQFVRVGAIHEVNKS